MTRVKLSIHLTGPLCAADLAAAPTAQLSPQDAEAALRRAEQVMGGKDLKTLSYSGSGTTFGQPSSRARPKLNYSSFPRLLDWDNAALREEFARSQAQPPGAGAVPVIELYAADDPISACDLSCCCHF